jgi:molybdopterin synthase catalytic subunit
MKSQNATVVSDRPLRPEELLNMVADPRHGAQALFVGVVRERHEGRAVKAVTYDAFPPLAEKVLADIAGEASKKWPVRIAAFHRIGKLEVGEASVIIAAGSEHRAEAFEACRFVIEQIKKRLPVWKLEHDSDGTKRWLEGCALHA